MANQSKGNLETAKAEDATRTQAQKDQAELAAAQEANGLFLPAGDPGRMDEAPEGGRFWVNGVLVDADGKSDAQREAEAEAAQAKVKADQKAAEDMAAAQDQADRDREAAQKQANDEAEQKRKDALAKRQKPEPPPLSVAGGSQSPPVR